MLRCNFKGCDFDGCQPLKLHRSIDCFPDVAGETNVTVYSLKSLLFSVTFFQFTSTSVTSCAFPTSVLAFPVVFPKLSGSVTRIGRVVQSLPYASVKLNVKNPSAFFPLTPSPTVID